MHHCFSDSTYELSHCSLRKHWKVYYLLIIPWESCTWSHKRKMFSLLGSNPTLSPWKDEKVICHLSSENSPYSLVIYIVWGLGEPVTYVLQVTLIEVHVECCGFLSSKLYYSLFSSVGKHLVLHATISMCPISLHILNTWILYIAIISMYMSHTIFLKFTTDDLQRRIPDSNTELNFLKRHNLY